MTINRFAKRDIPDNLSVDGGGNDDLSSGKRDAIDIIIINVFILNTIKYITCAHDRFEQGRCDVRNTLRRV